MKQSDNLEKLISTGCAQAALAGILATPSRTDEGKASIVLTKAHWTREVLPEQLADALAEAKQAVPA